MRQSGPQQSAGRTDQPSNDAADGQVVGAGDEPQGNSQEPSQEFDRGPVGLIHLPRPSAANAIALLIYWSIIATIAGLISFGAYRIVGNTQRGLTITIVAGTSVVLSGLFSIRFRDELFSLLRDWWQARSAARAIKTGQDVDKRAVAAAALRELGVDQLTPENLEKLEARWGVALPRIWVLHGRPMVLGLDVDGSHSPGTPMRRRRPENPRVVRSGWYFLLTLLGFVPVLALTSAAQRPWVANSILLVYAGMFALSITGLIWSSRRQWQIGSVGGRMFFTPPRGAPLSVSGVAISPGRDVLIFLPYRWTAAMPGNDVVKQFRRLQQEGNIVTAVVIHRDGRGVPLGPPGDPPVSIWQSPIVIAPSSPWQELLRDPDQRGDERPS